VSSSEIEHQNKIVNLQKQLEDEKTRHQSYLQKLQDLQNELDNERSRHRSETEAAKASALPVQNGPTDLDSEVNELRQALQLGVNNVSPSRPTVEQNMLPSMSLAFFV
jgi:molecular chaperone GrpE (heat shock protein)